MLALYRGNRNVPRTPNWGQRQHINLLGEYDFSEEKMQDSVGIRAPKNLTI